MIYSVHELSYYLYVVVKVTNKINYPFTGWLNDGEATTEMHEIATNEEKEIRLYGFSYGQTSAALARKNGKFINTGQHFIDVPIMYD